MVHFRSNRLHEGRDHDINSPTTRHFGEESSRHLWVSKEPCGPRISMARMRFPLDGELDFFYFENLIFIDYLKMTWSRHLFLFYFCVLTYSEPYVASLLTSLSLDLSIPTYPCITTLSVPFIHFLTRPGRVWGDQTGDELCTMRGWLVDYGKST